MRKAFIVVLLALGISPALKAQRGPNGLPPWAYNIPDKEQPPTSEKTEPIRVPGSAKTYTDHQIEDHSNPPDWFPEEHGAVPEIVKGGLGPEVAACGSCHLMSGRGHPQNADLAGQPMEYIVRQMAYFKSGARKDPARMNAVAKTTSIEDVRKAAMYFSALKPSPWVSVMESENVPKSFVSRRERRRLVAPNGGMEPLGQRIITLPVDSERAVNLDPHCGFVAYVPPGSIAKGKALAETGGSGKTIQCSICHGDRLEGLGDVPRLAGLNPVYIFRQLHGIQSGASAGSAVGLMKKVVEKLSEEDMIALSAYAGSLAP